ncbi:hypothetical protein JTE90_024301 [Oedothorax gibbosus]|uniref:Uncharacterized protein n=1 Tax=Oedothorax gibbosus TaxID=931172 RepID=A0AAV6VZH7_9ARAC|nr:hypothetical protein JTE90_024301 [Oedothorax gibbosus]
MTLTSKVFKCKPHKYASSPTQRGSVYVFGPGYKCHKKGKKASMKNGLDHQGRRMEKVRTRCDPSQTCEIERLHQLETIIYDVGTGVR